MTLNPLFTLTLVIYDKEVALEEHDYLVIDRHDLKTWNPWPTNRRIMKYVRQRQEFIKPPNGHHKSLKTRVFLYIGPVRVKTRSLRVVYFHDERGLVDGTTTSA